MKVFYFDVLVQLAIVSIVITSYSFLFHSAQTVPLSHFRFFLPPVFQKIVTPAFECETRLPVTGYLAPDETKSDCQLDLAGFTRLCQVMGINVNANQAKLLFQTLDKSGNGLLSWGELNVDYSGKGVGALEYYNQRFKWLRGTTFDDGLGLVSF